LRYSYDTWRCTGPRRKLALRQNIDDKEGKIVRLTYDASIGAGPTEHRIL